MSERPSRPLPASTWVPLLILLAITAVVPVIVFDQFRRADDARRELLLKSVSQQGEIVTRTLAPLLNQPVNDVLPELALAVADIDPTVATVRIFIRPISRLDAAGFYYVATNQRLSAGQMDKERQDILALGVLSNLGKSCANNRSISTNYTPKNRASEIITSITPYLSAKACWAVMVSHASSEYGNALSQNSWQSPEVRIAFILYVAMVLIVASLIASVLMSVRRMTRAARALREGRDARGFAERPAVREISEMAVELDRLVTSLRRSADDLRQAGEDNAHALKTPVATIRHAVEALDTHDEPSKRAVTTVLRSVDRLGVIAQNIRRMDEAAADSLALTRRPVDLSDLIKTMAADYAAQASACGVEIDASVEPELWVLGDVELLDTVVENLLDNALSFSPAGTTVSVVARRSDGSLVVEIADQGPGVAPGDLRRIFDRHISIRPTDDDTHSGIGLWVVQRYVAAHDGEIEAANRPAGGLVVTIRLPASKHDAG